MPRKPEVPGEPADQVLKVRVTAGDVALVDSMRGEVGRSAFVRNLIRATTITTGRRLTDGAVTADNPQVARHSHRPGSKEVTRRTLRGVTTLTYECEVPGCTVPLERKQ